MEMPTVRIGEGHDRHRLAEGRKMIIGGIEIPYRLGLEGHSDADVLMHAVTDAVIGALALGDIGSHFPDTDPKYKGVASSIFLKEACRLAEHDGYAISNVDSTVIAQEPKLAPYILQMRRSIASVMGIPVSSINIKAKTGERVGTSGRLECIDAHASVLLIKRS